MSEAQSVNLEAFHLPYDGACSDVVHVLKPDEPVTPETALANKRWWNGAMAAGGIPPYQIEYDHYRIIDEFFDACRKDTRKPTRDVMHDIGVLHRWIIPGLAPP